MRSRVDLLRNLAAAQWATVVNAILARSDSGQWNRGRDKLAAEGVDWLRRRLIREGMDVLNRYDQLLPADKRCVLHDNELTGRKTDGHLSPSVASSLSPPPTPRPAPVSSASDRRVPSRLKIVKPSPSPPKRIRRTVSNPAITFDSDDDSTLSNLTPPPRPPPSKRMAKPSNDKVSSRTRSLAPPGTPKLTLKLSPASGSPGSKPRFILSSSSVPCLIEAAKSRENKIEATVKGTESREARLQRRESSRTSIAKAAPFGVAPPSSLESRNEVNHTPRKLTTVLSERRGRVLADHRCQGST